MYPIFLDLTGKKCLVVGGGRVAIRKVLALLRSKADVTVVARESCSRLVGLRKVITLVERSFQRSDLTGAFMLVIGATDDQRINRLIAERAAELNIPCNIVDQPALCTFIVPAQVRRGDVTVAVSTGGVSPRFSRYLKGVVADTVVPLHGELATYFGSVRKRIRKEIGDIALRSALWEKLFEDDPVAVVRTGGWDTLRAKVETCIDDVIRKMKNDDKK